MIAPFNFIRLSDDSCFISNDVGFHYVIRQEDLNILIENDIQLEESLRQELKARLFVYDEEEKGAVFASLASGLAKKMQSELSFSPIYMIVPTLRCDHTCKYCQVSRAPLSSESHDLDEKLIPIIISKIQKVGQAPYKIELQGGEPLVRFDLVKMIYLEAQRQLGDSVFELIIATSLSLVNYEVLEWAKDKQVYFSTSLDGNELVHNKNRLLPNDSSYIKVSEGIANIKSILGGHKVSTVTTATSLLLDSPETIIDTHEELGLQDLFIRPISPYGFANNMHGYKIHDYMEFYRKLFDILIERFKSGKRMVEHSGKIHMQRIINSTYSSYADLKSPSGLVLNCVLFNYDGRVYGSDESRMLQATIDDVDFSAGSLDDLAFSKSPFYTKSLAESFSVTNPGCNDCAFQPYCGADVTQSISEQGEPVGDKSFLSFCEYHKSMFLFLIEKYDTDIDAKQMIDSWLYD